MSEWSDIETRFWAKVRIGGPEACWQWQASTFQKGYGQFKARGRNRQAHRFALELTLGRDIAAEEFVCHRCDNPACCNPAHLFIGDAASNNADMRAKGRGRAPKRGEGSGRKLNRAQVEEIRGRYASGGVSQRVLAAAFGVHQMTISRLVRGETW